MVKKRQFSVLKETKNMKIGIFSIKLFAAFRKKLYFCRKLRKQGF